MKFKKSTGIYFAVVIVAVLICIPTGSLGVFTNKGSENMTLKKPVSSSNGARLHIKISPQSVLPPTIISKQSEFNALDASDSNFSENIPVASDPGNESYPSMVVNGYNALVAYEYNENNKSHVYLRTSQDYGQTWSSRLLLQDIESNITSPSFCISPNSNKAVGTFVSKVNNSGIFYEIIIPDIRDIGDSDVVLIDWSNISYNKTTGEFYSFWNFSNPDIVYYRDIDPDVDFVIGIIGSTNFTNETTGEGPCINSPMFYFADPEGEPDTSWIAWYPEIQNCSNISISRDPDSSTNPTVYGVCEINNGTNQDVLFFSGDPASWLDEKLPLKNQTFTGPENLIHPQIFVKNNQIYIAMETDADGNHKIVFYNSSDNGENWTIDNITAAILPSNATPRYPILFANETHVACTFVESGNISFTISANNGTSWSIPVQLNDQNSSVVEGYRYANIGDMNHIVWTDNRNGNDSDIYSTLRDIPTADLSVFNITLVEEIPFFIPTKNYVSFFIKNNGTGYAKDVPITITYICDGESPITAFQGNLSYVVGDEPIYYERPLFNLKPLDFFKALINFAGIKNITITVVPSGDADENSVTKEVVYGDIFPKLAELEDFFKYLKNQ